MKIDVEMSDEAAERIRRILLDDVIIAEDDRLSLAGDLSVARVALEVAEERFKMAEENSKRCAQAYTAVFGPLPEPSESTKERRGEAAARVAQRILQVRERRNWS